MNGFSNDWFGSEGFRTMGVTREEILTREGRRPTREVLRGGDSFTPWSHGASTPGEVSAPQGLGAAPMPRLQSPAFGPAHSFALMSGPNPGFLGPVTVARRG